jgi:hypothetical protein
MVRTLLLLSLWHAPIPWLHAHDLSGPSVEHRAALHRHVDEFHAAELEHGEAHLGLHAHFILPWGHGHDPQHAPNGSDPADSDEDDFLVWFGGTPAGAPVKVVGQPTDRALGCVSAFDEQPAAERPTGGSAPLFSLSRGRHFFETYGQKVSAGDLFGVRLC